MAIIPATQRIEEYLDAGLKLIDARHEDKMAEGLDDWALTVQGKRVEFFSEDEYPDDYFSPSQDGKTYFTLDKLTKYPKMPHAVLILSDGTIYALPEKGSRHYETAAWLKYNGISLRDSLRVRYFPPSDKNQHGLFSIVPGYDHDETTRDNNFASLRSKWLDKYEYNQFNMPVTLTDEQTKALYIMGRRFGLSVEQIFNQNPVLCMDPCFATTNAQYVVGRDNDRTLTRVMGKMPTEELYVAADNRTDTTCI